MPLPSQEAETDPPAEEALSLHEPILAERMARLSEQVLVLSLLAPAAWVTLAFIMSDLRPQGAVMLWIALMLATDLASILLTALHRRLRPPPAQNPLWALLLLARAIASGLAWGASALLLWPPDRLDYQMLLLLFLCGASAVAMMANVAMRRCMLGFTFALWIFPLWQLYTSGSGVHWVIGLMCTMYAIIMMTTVLRVTRQLAESIRFRLQNAALVERLRREHLRAEAANRAKSRFLAAASHDLRQPVHALGFFLQSLRLGTEQAQTDRGLLHNLARQAQDTLQGLTGLLDTLLDVSQIEAGTVSTRSEVVPLQPLFDQLRRQFANRARSKGLRLHIRGTGLAVHSNPLALQRILGNLVENALRYTPAGTVMVAARRRGEEVELQVRDSGVGIPATEREAIFEEFYRLESARAGGERGLGLGLSIVRQLSQLLGHRLSLRSGPGQGSTFSIRVPRHQPGRAGLAAAEPEAELPRPAAGTTVLLIDDDADSLSAMRALLHHYGYRVIAVPGVEQALSNPEVTHGRLAAIVADYRLLHQKTGAEAIAAVNAARGQAVPALILTADTDPERLAEIAASGYPLQRKPVAPERFLRNVGELVQRAAAPVRP